jgi:hypothetical protein
MIPGGMAEEPSPVGARSKLATIAILLGLIAAAGVVGVALSVLQRPSQLPKAAPTQPPGLPPEITGSPTLVAPGPVSAFGFSVADDPAIHRVVLFGGVDNYGETWLWDGSRWSRAHPRASPLGRSEAAAAYDPETGLVMLFGGRLASGQIVRDTWAWSGTTWRELNNGVDPAPPGDGALMTWDSSRREMILLTTTTNATGGQTWVWSRGNWSRLVSGRAPPSPIAGEMAFDPVSDSVLFVDALMPPMGAGTTTWRFDGHGWDLLTATPPSATAGLTLDPASGRLLLCSDPTPDVSAQLWRWTGSAWSGVPQSQLSEQQGLEVTDLDRRQFLMVGFDTQPTQAMPQAIRVWDWSGSDWQPLGLVDPP